MIPAAIPENETERLRALIDYDILDTLEEENFDDLVKLASQICETSISLISLIDADRQWFKAKVGLHPRETSRNIAFCAHAILNHDVFIVPDATKDHRFFDNPLVTGNPDIRFYAGIPLATPGGHNIGTLCVIDTHPKTLNDYQLFALKTISKQVIAQLELRQKVNSIHEANIQLSDQSAELNRLNSISTKLISILSHDLRSPLITFMAYTDMFQNDDLGEAEKKSYAQSLSLSLGKTLEMVDSVLRWGVDQVSGQHIDVKPLNPKPIADNQIETLRLLFDAKKNTVHNSIDPNHLVIADENRLQLVFRNLIQNANKFTSGGVITLRSVSTGQFVEFSVTDTGVGISQEQLPRLFDWKTNLTTLGTGGEKGTGLGLRMCKEFVIKLGGEIRAESTVGKGTSFIFTLPSAKQI